MLDIATRRNAFGRQLRSFEADVELQGVEGGPMHAVFIRAPWVEERGERRRGARDASTSTRSRSGRGGVLAVSFHPELTGDDRLHRLLLSANGRASSGLAGCQSVSRSRLE